MVDDCPLTFKKQKQPVRLVATSAEQRIDYGSKRIELNTAHSEIILKINDVLRQMPQASDQDKWSGEEWRKIINNFIIPLNQTKINIYSHASDGVLKLLRKFHTYDELIYNYDTNREQACDTAKKSIYNAIEKCKEEIESYKDTLQSYVACAVM